MAFSVEKTGKTVEEAKLAALSELGVNEAEANLTMAIRLWGDKEEGGAE